MRLSWHTKRHTETALVRGLWEEARRSGTLFRSMCLVRAARTYNPRASVALAPYSDSEVAPSVGEAPMADPLDRLFAHPRAHPSPDAAVLEEVAPT